jgi:bacillithiol biosynthesis cysteine-adding enzyme BshC
LTDLFQSYLAGGGASFFAGQHFGDAVARSRATARAVRPLAATVADALEAQNARFAPSRARERNLALLRTGAAAAVTGQQVGLFLGPLYNLYKAASAIRVASELASATGAPVVPVFWLQTEDHDLPEIASCRLPCASGECLCLELPPAPDSRTSIAHLPLPAEVGVLLDRLKDAIGRLPHAGPHLERLRRHYRAGTGWAEAFAGMLAELFAPEGLVIVNPRCPELASVAAPIHRHAIVRAAPIADALAARGRDLEAAGFSPGVHVRPGAPLSFFHPDGARGARYRVEPDAAGWREVGGTRSHQDGALLAALDRDPLRFSTSVLLRPILQDTLLPTAAYVGGGGEIAYFAQLAPLYDEYGLAMPLVVPRASFLLIEEQTKRLLSSLGTDSGCATQPEDDVLAAAAPRATADTDRLRNRLLGAFAAELDRAQQELESAGPGMARAIEKARKSVEHAVHRLLGKYETARLHDRSDLVEAVRHIKQRLHPEGIPQERFFGLPYFAARYGERGFLERVLESIEPYQASPRDLNLGDGEA